MRRSMRRTIPLCVFRSSSQSEQLAFRSIPFVVSAIRLKIIFDNNLTLTLPPPYIFSPSYSTSIPLSPSLLHLPLLSLSLLIVVGVAYVIVRAQASAQKLNALKKIESLSLCKRMFETIQKSNNYRQNVILGLGWQQQQLCQGQSQVVVHQTGKMVFEAFFGLKCSQRQEFKQMELKQIIPLRDKSFSCLSTNAVNQ